MGSFIYLYTTNKHTKKSKVKPMRTVRPRPVQKSGNAQIDSGTAAFIKKQLLDFEVKAGVRVIYAVECGARGYGFASPSSDHDVRFVFMREKNEYLGLNRKTVESCAFFSERPGKPHIDFAGHDIFKFYRLLAKTKVDFIEQLFQSIVFVNKLADFEGLKNIVSHGFDINKYVSSCLWCAKDVAAKGIIGNPGGKTPTAKQYIHSIRMLLDMEYCGKRLEIPPLDFATLVKQAASGETARQMNSLLETKKKSNDDLPYENEVLRDFIASSIGNSSETKSKWRSKMCDFEGKLGGHLLQQLE